MTKHDLDKFLNKEVKITLIDDSEYVGVLELGMGMGNNHYNNDHKWYHIKKHAINFRVSHVKKIFEVGKTIVLKPKGR